MKLDPSGIAVSVEIADDVRAPLVAPGNDVIVLDGE